MVPLQKQEMSVLMAARPSDRCSRRRATGGGVADLLRLPDWGEEQLPGRAAAGGPGSGLTASGLDDVEECDQRLPTTGCPAFMRLSPSTPVHQPRVVAASSPKALSGNILGILITGSGTSEPFVRG